MATYHAIKGFGYHDSFDVSEAKQVEITIRNTNIWINTEDGCVARFIRCGAITVVDERAEDDKEDPD